MLSSINVLVCDCRRPRPSRLGAFRDAFTRIAFAALFISVVSGIPAEIPDYLSYELYQQLAVQFPELKNPRLISLHPAGHQLWANGQLRAPAQGVYTEGDFRGAGEIQSVLLVVSEGTVYALIAEQTSESAWKRFSLLELDTQPDRLVWTSRALKLGPQSFIAWSGEALLAARGPQAELVYEVQPKYEKLLEEWKWSKPEPPNLAAYQARYRGAYDVRIVSLAGSVHELRVHIGPSLDEPAYQWDGNPNSAFVVVGELLYRTEFHPVATGMKVVAYDLANQTELWRTTLHGLGPIPHSGYRNWGANLQVYGDVIQVIGRESAGGYVEFVHRLTGESFAKRVFLERPGSRHQ